MANNDKLWFDMGIRDEVSKKLVDIMDKAEELQETLDGMKIGRDAIQNAAELERALDKIAVAKDRLSESKGLATSKKDKDDIRAMERSLNKMEKSLEKFVKMGSDLDLAKMGSKGFAKFLEDMHNLSLAFEQVKRRTNEINAQAKEDERNKEAEYRRIDKLKEKYYELYEVRSRLQDAILSAAPGTDTSEAVSMLNSVTGKMGAVVKAQKNGGALPQSVVGAGYAKFLSDVKDKTNELTSATDGYNRELSSTESIQKNLQRMMLDTASQQKIAGIRKQTYEFTALGRKLSDIQDLMRRVNEDKNKFENGVISKPEYSRERVNAELDAIQRRYNEDIARGKQFEKDDADAKNQRAAASKKAAEAIQLVAHANQSLISSYNRIAQAGTQANKVTIQLQNQIGNYASIYGIERLLKSVITIGGQFEFQHIALQNILGDLQQANTLFSQLQTLAIESPKTFMELTAYTKQLSAYQIPYAELYDTTKRLADLSTGLGVDMSRLILAYGQVRSAAVLRGQELRQFTEAGIPLVQKLAEEFTRLNGKVVTTGEVFELISKRAVPFDMVKKILWDMTSEGGQFYNMQSELADTLYGKWQKLQDQWQITLGHIADGESISGKTFKVMIEGLVKITSLLDNLLPMLGMFGLGKAGVGIFNSINSALDKRNGTTAINNMKLAKEQEANRLMRERLMYGRQLTAEELRIVKERGTLVSQDYYLLGVEKQISAQKAHQLMLDGKMSKEHFYKLLQMQGYTREQRKQISQGNLESMKNKGGFGKSLLGFFGGWFGVAMTAAGAIMSLYSNAAQKAQEAKDAAISANGAILDDLKNINSLYNDLSKKRPESQEERVNSIERMTEALKESGRYSKELQDSLNATDSVTEKYNLLYEELQKVSSEYLQMKANVEAYLEAANRVGEGNWFTKMFNDPMSTDLKDWSREYIKMSVAIEKINQKAAGMKTQLVEFFKDNEIWNEAFKSLNWKELFEKLSSEQQTDFKLMLGRKAGDIITGTEESRIFYEELNAAVNEYLTSLANVKSEEEEVDAQMQEYYSHILVAIKSKAKLAGLDYENINKWGETDFANLSQWIDDIVNSYELDGDTAKKLRTKIINSFPKDIQIKIKPAPLKDNDLAPWQNDLKKYFDDHKFNGHALINITAETTFEKVEKELQDKKKEFQEQMNRGKGILINFHADFSDIEKSIQGLIEKYPYMRFLIEKAYADYKEGKSGEEAINQTGKDTGLNVDKDRKDRNNTDKWLKDKREQLKEIENFYKIYKRNSEYMANDDAIQKALDSGVFSNPKKLPKNIDDYLKVLQNFRKKVEKEIGKKPSAERKSFITDLITKIDEKEFEVKTKQIADAALKKLDSELKKQGKQWNLFKKILDATGNKEQASQIAFGGAVRFDNYAEQLREEISKALEGNKKASGVSIDTLLGLDEKQLKDDYDIFGEVVHKLKELEEVEQQLKSEDVELFLDALKNAKSLETELDQITLKYDKTRKAIKANGGDASLLQNADENEAREKADKQWEWFKKTNTEWGRVFGNLDKMTIKTLKDMKSQLLGLAPSLSESVESTKALYEAIEKIDNVVNKRNPFKAMGDALSKNSAIRSLLSSIKGSSDSDSIFISNATAKKTGIKGGMRKVGEVRQEGNDELRETTIDFNTAMQGAVSKFKDVQDALTPVIDLFNALGMTELGNFFSIGGNALGAAAQMSQGATALFGASAGPWGAVAGAGLSILTNVFSMHDKALQEEIDASKARQKEMENLTKNLEKALERTLGGVYRTKASSEDINRLLKYRKLYDRAQTKKGVALVTGTDYINNDTASAIDKALETESYYDTKRAELLVQRDELQKQLNAEENKKDSSASAIEDYKQQIKELEDEAENFAMDMAKTLYDIDIKSWASELGDALYEAWQKGEDGAEAFKKKASELIGQVAKKIISVSILEAALEPVKKIIAQMMDEGSGQLDPVKFAEKISTALEESLGTIGNTYEVTMDAVDAALQKHGYDSLKDSSSDTSSNTIKGVTEQTADLIASYLNAIRLDVSVNRTTLQNILDALLVESAGGNAGNVRRAAATDVGDAQQYAAAAGLTSELSGIAQAQLAQLMLIAKNTGRNAGLVQEVRDIMHRVTMGGDAIKVK